MKNKWQSLGYKDRYDFLLGHEHRLAEQRTLNLQGRGSNPR